MTSRTTEADLEARMHVVLRMAFPWLPEVALKHQTTFSIKLGHSTIEVDGRSGDRLHGRSDILVSANGMPLAILELKREGLSLTDDDVAQGLSYARLTTPMTPLVIASNGVDMRIHLSFSGDEWKPADRAEKELRQTLENIGKLAAGDLKKAVNILMGSEQTHWISAFQAVSRKLIESRSGNWNEPLAPFVRNFLLPRRATVLLADAIKAGSRAVVLHGPPLSGKSNVLRQLAKGVEASKSVSVLLLEPDESGVFGAMAHVLSGELDWKISSDDAREWLRSISHSNTATLILALDGVDPSMSKILADLNELASERFGVALRVILTVDDNALDGVTVKPNGREASSFGRIAEKVPLHPLDDIEFKHAREVLLRHRADVTRGAESVPSLREPWILRALSSAELTAIPKEPSNVIMRIPPLMDIEALHLAAASFPLDDETATLIRAAASVIVDQYLESRNSAALLQGISTFAVEQHRLQEAIGTNGISALRLRGFIKPAIDMAERPVWFFRVPTLLAAHVAVSLAAEIMKWSDSEEAAEHLITMSSRLPLGDIIAADALLKLATQMKGRRFLDLLSVLLRRAPTQSSLSPGTHLAFSLHGTLVRATVSEGRTLVVTTPKRTIEIDLGAEDMDDAVSDLGAWLILSHLAAVPLAAETPQPSEPARLDETLLLEIGQADTILSLAEGTQGFKEVAIHNIPGHGVIVCHKSGIVEPITWALVKFFQHRGLDAGAWIDEAIATHSLPLLSRIHIALEFIAGLADPRGPWARDILTERLNPALAQFPMHH